MALGCKHSTTSLIVVSLPKPCHSRDNAGCLWPCLLQGHRVLLLDSADAVATADLQQAATAALVGTNPEDFQACSNCSSASSAAAILVAGLIALKAGQRGGSGRNSPWLHAAGSPVNTAAAASPQLAPAAGSPAGRRARPFSAPCKGKGRGRSSSPAGVSAGQQGRRIVVPAECFALGACASQQSSEAGCRLVSDQQTLKMPILGHTGCEHRSAGLSQGCAAVCSSRVATAAPHLVHWGQQQAASVCMSSVPRYCLSWGVHR